MKFLNNIHILFSYINLKLNTVYKKIVGLTLVCSLFPLLAVSIISYCMSYSISKDRTIESIISTNKQIALNITNRMEQVESLADSISYHLYSLYQTPLTPLSNYLSIYSNSKNSIDSIKNTFQIFQITTFLPEDCYIDSRGNSIDFFPLQKLSDYHMSEAELYDSGSLCFWTINKDQMFPEAISPSPKTVLSCWSAYRNVLENSLNYGFACHIKVSEFQEMLDSTLGADSGFSFVIDQSNTILLHPDDNLLGTDFEIPDTELWDGEIHSFTDHDHLLVTHPLNNGKMLLISEIPLAFIRQNGNFVLTFSLISTLMILLCTVIFSVLISKTFTRRINVLSQVMKATQVNNNQEALKLLTPLIARPDNGKDEIDNLAVTYQHMIMENEEYFNKILDMTIQTEKLKYQLLQSQINPHFLFNTLNAIISCQALGKVQLAQQTISNLSQFYRHILHDPDVLIPIKEELSITELYLKIISVCRTNEITWSFNLEEGVENFMICKFIFQPFMENSVLHGIVDSTQALHIDLNIFYEEDSLLIEIKDNGAGISYEKQEEICATLKNHTANYDQHFGIGNVNVRLTPYFSEEHPFILLESTPGKGTQFTIHIQQIL